jgi:hypothetical protein
METASTRTFQSNPEMAIRAVAAPADSNDFGLMSRARRVLLRRQSGVTTLPSIDRLREGQRGDT